MKNTSSFMNMLRDRRGAVAYVVAVMLPVFLAFSALAIDMGYAYWTRNKLQITASAAALAGSRLLPDQTAAIVTALDYAEKNMPAARFGSVLAGADVVPGNWDFATRTFTPGAVPTTALMVTTRTAQANGNPLQLFFAPAVGLTETDINTSAIATFGTNKSWDLTIVQDVTGSFSAELPDARVADEALLTCIRDNSSPNSQVGLTAFTGFGTILAPLMTVGTDYATLSTEISNLDRCGNGGMPECSGTHVGAGIESAIAQFTDPLFTPGSNAFGQAMVIVGDGEPNARDAAQPYDGSCSGDCTNADLERIALEQADAADALGISVYTVFYDENNDDTAAAFFESLVRGNGVALRTPNSADLPDLLFEICSAMPRRLVN